MRRFRTYLVSLSLSALLTLLAAATVLADSQPPWPR
jgi:heme/copper-type cytochrome/quinol oxidase subunit 4